MISGSKVHPISHSTDPAPEWREDRSAPETCAAKQDRPAGNRQNLEAELIRQREANRRLTDELAEQQRINDELIQDLNQLTSPLESDRTDLLAPDEAAAPIPPAEPSAGEPDRTAQRLIELERLVEEQRREIDQWRRLAAMPASDDRSIFSESEPDREEDDDRICRDCDDRACSEDLPRPCLNGCRVALVGGHDGLTPEYCKLVEDLGGEALIHNGKVKNGSKKVRDLVRKSDLVVYLTTINSHGAMKSFKKHCKLCSKPFCPCRGTGVGALRSFLEDEVGQKILPAMFD